MTEPDDRLIRRLWRAGLPGLLLGVIVAATYANSLSVPLLLDDFAVIRLNPSIRDLRSIGDVLFAPPEIYSAGRPLLNVTYAVNYAVHATGVRGYHAANIAIHACAALVLLGLVRRTLELPRLHGRFSAVAGSLALAVAAIWATHPLQTNCVTYISQRAESLMALCYLFTLYAFVRAVATESRLWHAASVLACFLGMAAKEVMVTAPVAVFLLDWFLVAGSPREAWRQRRLFYLSLAASWLLLATLMFTSRLHQRSIGIGTGVSVFDYPRIEVRAILTYLRLGVWPHALVFDYGPGLRVPNLQELIPSAALLVALLTVIVAGIRRSRPAALLGALFFLVLAPTSSVVPLSGQPIAENRAYLPLAALVTAGVAGAYVVAGTRVRWACALLVVALGAASYARNQQYRQAITIWRDTVAKQPGNDRAWVYLSEALAEKGLRQDARIALATGLRHKPDSPELNNHLAVALFEAGNTNEAIRHFEAAVRVRPNYADGWNNFGLVLFQTNNFPRALACFQTVLRLRPPTADLLNFTGMCLQQTGNLRGAVEHYEQALQRDPNHASARTNLQRAQARR